MIAARRGDIPLVQLPGNILIAYAGEPPLKDFSNHGRNFRVWLNAVVIVGAFLITVNRPVTDKLPVPLFCREYRQQLPGNVLAVNLVDDIFQRHNIAVLGPFSSQRIKIIVDSNKPHIQKWENPFQIVAGFPVVTAKPG